MNVVNVSDIDECAASDHGCHTDAHCENLPGSYRCVCNEGYTGDGTQCDSKPVLVRHYTVSAIRAMPRT